MYDKAVIERIRPGMHLCSSDYKKWGEVEEVIDLGEGSEPVVSGHVDADGRSVWVPAAAVLEIRGERCVRFDAVLTEADEQGWDRRPEPAAT